MVLDNICKDMNCEDYQEWEFRDPYGQYEQPYPCISCARIGQSYNITEIAKDCPYRDIIQQWLSGSDNKSSSAQICDDFEEGEKCTKGLNTTCGKCGFLSEADL